MRFVPAMQKLVVLLILLTASSTKSEDLTKKVFVFPAQSTTRYVTLTPDVEGPFSALTLCLRSFLANTRAMSLFSLATPAYSNAFLLFHLGKGNYQVNVNNHAYDFLGMPDKQNEWNSVCWTWDMKTGLTQVWVNGMRSIRMKSSSKQIAAAPIIILGQEQDTYGGGFDAKQCLVGELSDVHMWNYVLDSCEIKNYMSTSTFTPGNVLNWKALNYNLNNDVLVETDQSDGCL